MFEFEDFSLKILGFAVIKTYYKRNFKKIVSKFKTILKTVDWELMIQNITISSLP